MTFWYKGQAPDLYVKFENTTVGIHREVVKSIPYFAEIIEYHPVECKEEAVEIPMSSDKGLLYLEHIYSGHRTLEDKLKMLQSSHYFGDDSGIHLIPMNKTYSHSENVLILNVLASLTNHETFQGMFLAISSRILHSRFFGEVGVHLTKYTFQDIIRSDPGNSKVLVGLMEWERYRPMESKAEWRDITQPEARILKH